jgi:nitrate reductase NapAB chaperone NapD
MVLVGALARIEEGEREDVDKRLSGLTGVETFPVEQQGSMGLVIEAEDIEAAHRVLTEEVSHTAGVLGAWPVSAWYEDADGEDAPEAGRESLTNRSN